MKRWEKSNFNHIHPAIYNNYTTDNSISGKNNIIKMSRLLLMSYSYRKYNYLGHNIMFIK